jgi:predicted heme/steroid binding protein
VADAPIVRHEASGSRGIGAWLRAFRPRNAWIVAFAVALVTMSAFVGVAEDRDIPVAESVLREAVRKRYSASELARQDGRNPAEPILIAVRGIVFDVSEGGRFYASGSRYHAMAGRDASRAVARMSLAPEDLTDDCSTLTEAEWTFLERVLHETYLAKYPVAGHLAGGAFYPKGLCCQKDGCGDC